MKASIMIEENPVPSPLDTLNKKMWKISKSDNLKFPFVGSNLKLFRPVKQVVRENQ